MVCIIRLKPCKGIFEAYAGNVFKHYEKMVEDLFGWDPSLTNWFPTSVFASISFNLGPRTVSWPHTDSYNLGYGWCAITALGKFNPDLGGHLILWNLGLVIRFPPGSTILIPSSLLTHSNVPIQKGETRYSIIQYSSSGLFRWIYNGFRSDKTFEAEASDEEKRKQSEAEKSRWDKGVDMFSKWSDVVNLAK